jgi:hypothetical protein
MILEDIDKTMRTKCGFTGLSDVESKQKEDRMETFFLSETMKYLYLLFDQGIIEHLVQYVKLTDN